MKRNDGCTYWLRAKVAKTLSAQVLHLLDLGGECTCSLYCLLHFPVGLKMFMVRWLGMGLPGWLLALLSDLGVLSSALTGALWFPSAEIPAKNCDLSISCLLDICTWVSLRHHAHLVPEASVRQWDCSHSILPLPSWILLVCTMHIHPFLLNFFSQSAQGLFNKGPIKRAPADVTPRLSTCAGQRSALWAWDSAFWLHKPHCPATLSSERPFLGCALPSFPGLLVFSSAQQVRAECQFMRKVPSCCAP
jgi:hypothetical protein